MSENLSPEVLKKIEDSATELHAKATVDAITECITIADRAKDLDDCKFQLNAMLASFKQIKGVSQ